MDEKKASKKNNTDVLETEKPKVPVNIEGLDWYIINTYSGHENKVAKQLQQRIKASGLEKEISDVLVPTQDKIVVSNGKKRTIQEKVLPGYVLIQMKMSDDAWQLIRNTDGVTGFVGTEKKPTKLAPIEVKKILAYLEIEQPSYQTSFAIGDAVKVSYGPFKDFVGSINEINEDKEQVKVLLSVFGRETPVVLDFLQVNKL